MGIVVFSNYLLTGAERDTFDVGHVVTLNTLDGFSNDYEPELAEISFVVSDHELMSASESAYEDPQRFRALLHSAPVITATVVDSTLFSARCRVERGELVRDLYGRKERSNEILDRVRGYDDSWRSLRDGFEQMGAQYRYVVPIRLPKVSAVRESLRRGLVASKRRWDNTFLLESFPDEQAVRVVAHGPVGLEPSGIYDVVDADEYQSAIEQRAAAAQLRDEARFWRYLLD